MPILQLHVEILLMHGGNDISYQHLSSNSSCVASKLAAQTSDLAKHLHVSLTLFPSQPYQVFMQCGMQAAYSTMHMWNSLSWVLAVESINGITFACFWPAGTLHCTKIAPPGMAATVQVSHAYFGLLLCCPLQTQHSLDKAARLLQL